MTFPTPGHHVEHPQSIPAPNPAPGQPRAAKPPWLKVRFPGGEKYNWIRGQSESLQLATVCEEARCPNIGECWNGGTATFMLMGDTCTRGCKFCSVKTAKRPGPLDPLEPEKLLDTISRMDLTYVVLTSVDRDDLADQGSGHLAHAIARLRAGLPDLLIEMLIPDFQGRRDLLQTVAGSAPHVLAHNVETVERLQRRVRDPRAGYAQSLEVLRAIKEDHPEIYTKSSLMLGVGEKPAEVARAMEDMRAVGVSFLTLGQYLQPAPNKMKVREFVHPDAFAEYARLGESLGFEYVASGPLVRSSYKAAEYFIERRIRENA